MTGRNLSILLVVSSLITPSFADDFRHLDEPGIRRGFDDEDAVWTAEKTVFLNCSLREFLNTEYVEACAIFKEDGQRHLECRFQPNTYEDYSGEELSYRRNSIAELCARESFK